MLHLPPVAHAGLSEQKLTRSADFGTFHEDPKDERVLDSSVSCSTLPAVSQPFQKVVVGDSSQLEHHDLPSWTALVVSESEESAIDELPLRVKETQPSKSTKKLSHKGGKTTDNGSEIAMRRQKVQQASGQISGIYSASRHSPDPLSLQEVLQATFRANDSYNISSVAPIDSEGSCPDLTVVPSKRRLLIHSSRKSTREQSETSDTLLLNATGTAVPKTASRKAASIRYDSQQEVIDAALDTRLANITWRRMRYTRRNRTNQVSHDVAPSTKRVSFEDHDAVFHFDGPTARHNGEVHASVGNQHCALPRKFTPMLDRVRPTAVPRQSNGEKFNERLYAMFGSANRPHSLTPGRISPATAEPTYAFIPARKLSAGKPLSTISSSGSATSTTSLAQNTEVTSITSDLHDISRKRTYAESNLGDEPVKKKKKIQVDEDHILEWVSALQRLIKGKTETNHEGMNHLSVVLAEIESAYPHIDSELARVTSLQAVLQQLAKFKNIPFTDEHKLRHRAKKILAERLRAKA